MLRVRAVVSFITLSGVFFAALAVSWVVPAAAEPPAGKAVVVVQGMACPFCAYGLEKRIKSIDGVSGVQVDVGKSQATIEIKEGATVSDEQIREAVRRAGFTPGKIRRAGKSEADG